MHKRPVPQHLLGSKESTMIEAAALGYNAVGGDYAPRLLASGKGRVAEKILELAEQYDLPIHRDPTLVSVLGALDVGTEIPPDLYGVIAEVLAWAYQTDMLAREHRY
jgi:flagellar biosynthesis protein